MAVACPSTTRCTAVDNNGTMLTFQPRTGKRIARAKIDKPVGLDAPSGDSNDELDGIACPGTTFCVAVDTLGNVVTFNPGSRRTVTPNAIDTGHSLTGVACPSAARCVLVDSGGRVLAGNPRHGGWMVTALRGAAGLTAVACPSAGTCVAVDSAGDEFAGRR